MRANRSRSIKEFFTCKESQQKSCLQENDSPTRYASSDEETERRGLSNSNQGRCFYVCRFWFILYGIFFQVNELTQQVAYSQ